MLNVSVHTCIILNKHKITVWCVCLSIDESAVTVTKFDANPKREILRLLWWMSWLQFTTCKHALPTCCISDPLAIIWLCIKAVCLFCSPFAHFVFLLACNPQRITTFSIFQFQLLPLERGLMNVAHIRVTSEITPPFFLKKIHQAESASPRDVWFSTQGECLSQRPIDSQRLVRSEKDRDVQFLGLL